MQIVDNLHEESDPIFRENSIILSIAEIFTQHTNRWTKDTKSVLL